MLGDLLPPGLHDAAVVGGHIGVELAEAGEVGIVEETAGSLVHPLKVGGMEETHSTVTAEGVLGCRHVVVVVARGGAEAGMRIGAYGLHALHGDVGREYAVELVQQFNNIMATQKDGVAFSTVDTFGGIWDFFNLTVQVSKEDGTMMIDKTYKIGEKIDLPLPEFGGDGPSGPQAATEAQVSPGS